MEIDEQPPLKRAKLEAPSEELLATILVDVPPQQQGVNAPGISTPASEQGAALQANGAQPSTSGAAAPQAGASEPTCRLTQPAGQPSTSQPAAAGAAGGVNGVNGVNGTSSAAPRQQLGAYSSREEFLIQQEITGDLAFKYVLNDGAPQNMIWLICLKNIFSKQLPNMPKEYIARLVLDRRHRSIALVKRDGTVLGGITYRVFQPQGLGEIAFCAVSSSEQVKGFGTRLMNYTKLWARDKDGLTHFLTYADNNAVGYFLKQGFTKELTLERERWAGYIKDYDGGTLMECIIHPKLPFTTMPDIIRTQKAALDTHIRVYSISHIVYPGLQHFRQSANPQPLEIADLPGVKEAGWKADQYPPPAYQIIADHKEGPVPPTQEALNRLMQACLQELRGSADAWPFLEPVNRMDVPDYYDVIKDPIDLASIEKRLQRGTYYVALDIFVADVRRIFSNCRIYNAPESIYHKAGNNLEAVLDEFLYSRLVIEDPTPAMQ